MLLTILPLAAMLAAGAPSKHATRHPDVGAAGGPDACATCHAEATPRVVKQWEEGRHGLLLVKCFVCHGSTGADFARRPEAARCGGCHPAELASLARAGKSSARAGCFACHAPHALAAAEGKKSPHAK